MRKLGVVALVVCGFLIVAFSFPLIYSVNSFAIQLMSIGQHVGRKVYVLQFGVSILVFLAVFLLGVGLIAWRHRLADRLFEDSELDMVLDGAGAVRLALIVGGVFMTAFALANAIGAVGRWASFYLTQRSAGLLDVAVPPANPLPGTLLYGAQAVIGLALIGLAKPIAERLWDGRRPAPVPVVSDAPHCPQCGEPFEPSDYASTEDARCIKCHSPLYPDDV